MTEDALYSGALQVLRTLRSAGYEALFAGGCVRDRILGIAPKDYDIATNALPDQVSALFARTVLVGKAFGVVKVVLDDQVVEVATYRTEGRYLDGRRPEWVKFATAREDVLRRDFTINGMLLDPVADAIVDYVGGQEDLRRRIIRTIGNPNDRFEEDKLRMLRAVRFSCQLDFPVEASAVDAIRARAAQIAQVSHERITEELKRILISPRRSRGMQHLLDWGLLQHILPELGAMVGVAQPPEFHPEGDVWVHTLLALDQLQNPDFVLAMGTLLHDVGKPPTYSVDGARIRFNGHDSRGEQMALEICKRLRLSNEETERIAYLVGSHMKFKDVAQMRPSTLKRFLSHPYFEELKKMCRADILAASKDLGSIEFVEKIQKEMPLRELRPAPLIGGRDLIDLGLSPGPLFTEILKRVEDSQLEGEISTREQALDFVRRRYLKQS